MLRKVMIEKDLLVTKYRLIVGIEYKLLFFKDHWILLNKKDVYSFATLNLYFKLDFERDRNVNLSKVFTLP